MLDPLILLLTLAIKAASLWFLVTALFALRPRRRIPVSPPQTRFACVIAARNGGFGTFESAKKRRRRSPTVAAHAAR